jgi:hypothetical protein
VHHPKNLATPLDFLLRYFSKGLSSFGGTALTFPRDDGEQPNSARALPELIEHRLRNTDLGLTAFTVRLGLVCKIGFRLVDRSAIGRPSLANSREQEHIDGR